MKQILILDQNDLVDPEDWCRPLSFFSEWDNEYMDRSPFSGTPENNYKWVKVKHTFGKCWYGHAVNELCKLRLYEFARGDPPNEHLLNMKGYTILTQGGNHE